MTVIAYFGDSTIAGADGNAPIDGTVHFTTPLTAYITGTVLNLGVGGQTLAMMLSGSGVQAWGYGNHVIKTLAAHIADLDEGGVVVIEGGINDFNSTTFADDLNDAIDVASGLTVILQTPNRVTDGRAAGVADKAQTIRNIAIARGLGLIDMHYGTSPTIGVNGLGVHPDFNGYAVMGAYAEKRIKQILAPTFPALQRSRAALGVL